jgi:hypothetical protein
MSRKAAVRTFAALLTATLVPIAPSLASAASVQPGGFLTKNLIRNAGFDADACTDGYSALTPKKWKSAAGAPTVICWKGGEGSFPNLHDKHPRKHGANFAAGGDDAEVSNLTQTIKLKKYADAIDAGTVVGALSGYLGGFANQEDATTITVTWRDASGAALGATAIGPVTAADRHGKTGLWKRAAKQAVPAGTRSALITIEMDRTEGIYNDGYVDTVSLRLK